MPEILIQSKITTPQLHEKIVHRERLTSLLNDNKNKNLIIVCAPAGFGKTTLVLDYLSTQKNKQAWFSIPQKGIEDAPTFFEYLIGAVKNLKNDFGDSTAEVMKQFTQNPKMSKELVYGCTASFVNEFQKCFTDDVVLVIEDLHYIESEKAQKWLAEFFEELLNNIPSNLHLILSTRIIPEMYLTQLKARRNVLMIDENDLIFNEEETGVLLDEVYKYRYDKNDIKLLDENVKGWITGLHLLLQAYGEDFAKIKYKGELDKEIIFDFFAHEIFDNLSPELQEFMMVTSLMESFDEELANAVLGIENSKQLTEVLVHRNLFIHQVHSIAQANPDKKTSYGYHALFRDFLKRRLESSRIAEKIKGLMEKIGDSYLCSGDEISAINYFIQAENIEKAEILIKKNTKALYKIGKYEVIWKWLNLLPETLLNEDPELLYLLGYHSFYKNADSEKALHFLSKAEKLYNQENYDEGLVDVIFLKTKIFINKGKIDQSISVFENLLTRNLKPEKTVSAMYWLSAAYNLLRQHKKALDLLEKALELCNNYKVNKTEIYSGFATCYFCLNDFEKSLFYLKLAHSEEKNFDELILSSINIAMIYEHLEDYNNSIKYFKETFKTLESSYSRDRHFSACCSYATLMQSIGNFEDSSRMLEKHYPIAERNDSILDLVQITQDLFRNYYFTNDAENSLKYLNLMKAYSEKSQIEFCKYQSQLLEASYLIKYNLNPFVKEKLINCYNYDCLNNRSYSASLKYLTKYYLLINDTGSALEQLIKILNKSNFRANNLIDLRDVIDFALSRPELSQYKDKVHHAFTQFFDRPNIEGTSDEYKRKMKIEIEKLYDIKMTSFGPLEFISRGVPVPESKWKKKKGKFILAYIMLNPKGKYNKDKIIDMFFPDAKPETVEDNFKQAVFSIRSTFKNPYLNFLILENKMLYLNPDCYFKSDAEEFNKLCNIARSAEHSCEEKIKACKDAIMLYKGEFMEGNYEPWCEDLRGDFHNKFISISELLLVSLVQMKKYEDVIRYSEKLLKHDKLNEKAYLSLVEAFVKTEKPKSARESYSKMLKTYEEELGEDPDQKTLSKIESLLES